MYLDKRTGVQENTSMRSREFPRAQPEGIPECCYLPVLSDSSQFTSIIHLLKVHISLLPASVIPRYWLAKALGLVLRNTHFWASPLKEMNISEYPW